jgi:hypothetical protein
MLRRCLDISLWPNIPELSSLSRPNNSLLSEHKVYSQDSFTSFAIFLPSAMLDSQVFSMISPLVHSEMGNLGAISIPSFS